jgi:hypothetical protein
MGTHPTCNTSCQIQEVHTETQHSCASVLADKQLCCFVRNDKNRYHWMTDNKKYPTYAFDEAVKYSNANLILFVTYTIYSYN